MRGVAYAVFVSNNPQQDWSFCTPGIPAARKSLPEGVHVFRFTFDKDEAEAALKAASAQYPDAMMVTLHSGATRRN